ALLGTLPTLESLVNPNTQRLVVREGARPRPGEAWIAEAVGAAPAERASERVMRIAGRSLPGVRALPRATAWRAYDREGRPDPAAIGAACALLLCNPAFEEAMIG
ncbi:MAG: hypothetical protein ACREM2_05025, partial [Vulcanimicrobiaceae bacterium]